MMHSKQPTTRAQISIFKTKKNPTQQQQQIISREDTFFIYSIHVL